MHPKTFYPPPSDQKNYRFNNLFSLHFRFEAHEDCTCGNNRENMGLCGVWKDTTERNEIDTTSDDSQPPHQRIPVFSIVKTVTTKQNPRTILLIIED